jgi:lipopolysaccharide export system permease protein
MRHIVRPLDRYVFNEFWKIFSVTALGFPVLLVVIDLADHAQQYLDRHIPGRDLALSYLFWIPDSMFMVLPAAVLFATVFSIGAFTRHAEVTAAKASGISFYRMILPILMGSVLACGLDLALGEVVPLTNRRRTELLREDRAQVGTNRYNFAVAGEFGRVYKAGELRTDIGSIRNLQIERKGSGRTYPTYILAADTAVYNPKRTEWTLRRGVLSIIGDTSNTFTVSFAAARDKHFTELPTDMMSKPRDPHDMRYDELSRFIAARFRSRASSSRCSVRRWPRARSAADRRTASR